MGNIKAKKCLTIFVLFIVVILAVGCLKQSYKLDVMTTGNGQVQPDSGKYQEGEGVKLKATPDAGWVFDHWEGSLTGEKNPVMLYMDSDKFVEAVFKRDGYFLSTGVTGSGTVNKKIISGSKTYGYYKEGSQVQLTAQPEPGWRFDHWEGDVSDSQNPLTITIDRNKTIKAVFVKSKYALTVNVVGNGIVAQQVVEYTTQSYESGTLVKLTAAPDSGWYFGYWEGDVDDTQTNPTTVVMDSDKTINVVFLESTTNTTVEGTVTIHNTAEDTATASLQNYSSAGDFDTVSYNQSVFTTEYVEGEVVIKFESSISQDKINNIVTAHGLKQLDELELSGEKIYQYQIPTDKTVWGTIDDLNSLLNVEWAEPNYKSHATAVPNDPEYSKYQWGPINLNLEPAWDIQTGDQGIVVAVVDSGIILTHEDLYDNLLTGYDFVDDDTSAMDETTDKSRGSHGTHVAGIIGAVGNNSTGMAGVNWNVNILPVRVLGTDGSGTHTDIAAGIDFAVQEGADIINLSFGSSSGSSMLKTAIDSAVSAGVTVIAATGNDNSTVRYPAAYANTIAVGAVDKSNKRSSYSNYGPEVDLVAPGGDGSDPSEMILSTWGYKVSGGYETGYIFMNGTSRAAPYVSGVAALLAANGVSDPANIKNVLTNTAIDLGLSGKDDEYGYGLVDAYAALLGQKLKNPTVFAATINGDTVEVKSDMLTMTDDGSYYLPSFVGTQEMYLIGWRDVNGNGEIDGGDYYGEMGPYDLTISDTNNINIDMYYLPHSSTQTSQQIKGL